MNHPRHRRRVSALALLAVAGSLWWVHRPPVDDRFLGKWSIRAASGVASDRRPAREFRSDGLLAYSDQEPAVHWVVEGNRLMIVPRPVRRRVYRSLADVFRAIRETMTPLESRLDVACYDVQFPSESVMLLWRNDRAIRTLAPTTWERVSD